jgi:hypothetical protein
MTRAPSWCTRMLGGHRADRSVRAAGGPSRSVTSSQGAVSPTRGEEVEVSMCMATCERMERTSSRICGPLPTANFWNKLEHGSET